MSTAPRGSILFRYTPGVGRSAAIECGNPTATCMTAFSTSGQTLTAGTAVNVAHNTVPFFYGINVVTGTNGYFQPTVTGIFKIIPSVQYLGAGNGTVTIWIKVNGVNLDNTATLTHFKQNDEGVITCEYLLELAAYDQVQVWALAQTADCTINYIAAGGTGDNTYPAAPGVITNMYRIR